MTKCSVLPFIGFWNKKRKQVGKLVKISMKSVVISSILLQQFCKMFISGKDAVNDDW